MRDPNSYRIAGATPRGEDEFQTRRLVESKYLNVTHRKGLRKRPWPMVIDTPAELCTGLLLLHGTLLLGDRHMRHTTVALPRSVIFLRGPAKVIAQTSRGSHSQLLVTWTQTSANALSDWLGDHKPPPDHPYYIATCPKGTPCGHSFDQILDACHHPSDDGLPSILGALHLLVAHAVTKPPEFTLSHVAESVPLAVEDLVREVRKNPSASWSLKDASSFAGYSPFHLSRTFRTLVGYGFPEFVDRCRTEMAIRMMSNANVPIDDVALKCGFGSTQALRDSFREYLGLLPSEIRSHGESD